MVAMKLSYELIAGFTGIRYRRNAIAIRRYPESLYIRVMVTYGLHRRIQKHIARHRPSKRTVECFHRNGGK